MRSSSAFFNTSAKKAAEHVAADDLVEPLAAH
jgi:hypothetical protein